MWIQKSSLVGLGEIESTVDFSDFLFIATPIFIFRRKDTEMSFLFGHKFEETHHKTAFH